MPAGGGGGGLSGFSKPADTTWRQWFELTNILNLGIGFSLGFPRISFPIPRIRIPTVVPIITRGAPVAISDPAVRLPEPSDKSDVQKVAIALPGQAGYVRQQNKLLLGIPLGATGRLQASPLWNWVTNAPMPGIIEAKKAQIARAATAAVLPPPDIEDGDMDLGDLLGQLGGAYIQAKYAPPPSPSVGFTPSLGTAGGGIPAAGFPVGPIDIPYVDVIPEAGSKGMVWSPKANCGAGGWVRRRRRRKRLASASDIKDIASLKAVMGPAMLKVWIATHS